MSKPSAEPSPKLILAAFVDSQEDEILLQQGLSQEQATLSTFRNVSEFIDYLEDQRHELDGIILKVGSFLPSLVAQLYQRAILLPAVILSPQSSRHGATPELESNATSSPDLSAPTACHYHQAEMQLNSHQEWKELPLEEHLQRAISDFLKLHTKSSTATKSQLANGNEDHHQLLMTQQRRLADKLQGKREQRIFLRNLEPIDQEQLVSALREEYRTILLSYFDDDADTNTKVDSLVDTAFFADISVAKVVEIHMWLMDEFSKQLKLEGRSPEILLDYRLTLIDVIAHLCEMYRRSVPRKS